MNNDLSLLSDEDLHKLSVSLQNTISSLNAKQMAIKIA